MFHNIPEYGYIGGGVQNVSETSMMLLNSDYFETVSCLWLQSNGSTWYHHQYYKVERKRKPLWQPFWNLLGGNLIFFVHILERVVSCWYNHGKICKTCWILMTFHPVHLLSQEIHVNHPKDSDGSSKVNAQFDLIITDNTRSC